MDQLAHSIKNTQSTRYYFQEADLEGILSQTQSHNDDFKNHPGYFVRDLQDQLRRKFSILGIYPKQMKKKFRGFPVHHYEPEDFKETLSFLSRRNRRFLENLQK